MLNQLFESLREWVKFTRRSKDSKKPSWRDSFEGARELHHGGRRSVTASREINLPPEPVLPEFMLEQRSLEASWLNIIQLTEPQAKPVSSSLQDRYKP